MNPSFPRMFRVRQNFPARAPLDLRASILEQFGRLRIKPGTRVAVGVGSRGIANLAAIVGLVLEQIRAADAQPFVIPAMGSHGGATPEGQREVLASYGLTEKTLNAAILDSLEVEQIGTTADGVPVFCSVEALAADGIVIINRVKPHTDFSGSLGSGLLKMCVIGLGKRAGATAMHQAASTLGHERVVRGMAHVVLGRAPILGGIAILENQFHDTARLVALPKEEMEKGEEALLAEARALMPLLPFDEIDLLIVDQLGKNISGAGMDPNVTGRGVQGYSGSLQRNDRPAPFIKRIFVRELTPETHGNAIGIGLADVTTTRLVRAMDSQITSINALTALTPQCAKIPIHFESDREAMAMVLASLAIPDPRAARIVRILDTLSLIEMEVSEAMRGDCQQRSNLSCQSEPYDMRFDETGNLQPLSPV
jgi:hypothetical protein